MDGQSDCNGENTTQKLGRFCISVFFVNVRVQCFYHKVIEKAADRSKPDGQDGPPQAVSPGQIIALLNIPASVC